MTFFKKIKDIFRKNYVCHKCGDLTDGKDLCEKCTKYFEVTKRQKVLEICAKEEMKRRNWIKIRDDFLKNQDGS